MILLAREHRIFKIFKKSLTKLSLDKILELAENDSGINNVLAGIAKESFSLDLTGFEKNKQFALVYITLINNKPFGLSVTVELYKKNRNGLTYLFSKHIAENYSNDSISSVFNTYQHFQTSFFNQINVFAYDDEFKSLMAEKKGELTLPSYYNGVAYVPMYNDSSRWLESIKVKKRNRVYLIKNKNNGYYKIGSSKDPNYIIKMLKVHKLDVELIENWIAPVKKKFKLHNKYLDRRIKGDWFRLSHNDVQKILCDLELFKKI